MVSEQLSKSYNFMKDLSSDFDRAEARILTVIDLEVNEPFVEFKVVFEKGEPKEVIAYFHSGDKATDKWVSETKTLGNIEKVLKDIGDFLLIKIDWAI